MMKKFLSTLVTGSMVLGQLCFGQLGFESLGFSDVVYGSWYYDYVTDMAAGGFVAGQSGDYYGVEANLNLAEFSTMLANAFYGDTLDQLKGQSSGSWWEPYVNAVYQREGMSSTMGGYYYAQSGTWGDFPSRDLTRYDMASMVASLVIERGNSPLSDSVVDTICDKLTDEIHDHYRRDVATAYYFNLIGGRNDGSFDGAATLNRTEAAVVLSALVKSDNVPLEQSASSAGGSGGSTGGTGGSTGGTGGSTGGTDGSTGSTGGSTGSGSIEDLHPFVIEVFALINEQREDYGLYTLTLDTTLCALAQYKADEMSELNYLDHTSPTYGAFSNILSNNGIFVEKARENLAQGQRSPAEVVEAWMNSVDHKTNILAIDIGKIGIGFTEGDYYWTQLFTDSNSYTGGQLSDDLGGSTGVGGMTSGDYSYAMEIPYYQYENYFTVGYVPSESLIEIPVDNTGDYGLNFNGLQLYGADADYFKGYVSAANIGVGGRQYIIIEPMSGLPVGGYTVSVQFSVANLPPMSQTLNIYVADPVEVNLPNLEPAPEYDIPDHLLEGEKEEEEALSENAYILTFYGEDCEEYTLSSSKQSASYYEDTGETRVLFTFSEALPQGVVVDSMKMNHFDATVTDIDFLPDKSQVYVTFQDLPYSGQMVELDVMLTEGYLLIQKSSPISMTVLINGKAVPTGEYSPYLLQYRDTVEVIIPEVHLSEYRPQMSDAEGEPVYPEEESSYGLRSTGIFRVYDNDFYVGIGVVQEEDEEEDK